jgi:hypothetical protein
MKLVLLLVQTGVDVHDCLASPATSAASSGLGCLATKIRFDLAKRGTPLLLDGPVRFWQKGVLPQISYECAIFPFLQAILS